jgi:hypothetical protein
LFPVPAVGGDCARRRGVRGGALRGAGVARPAANAAAAQPAIERRGRMTVPVGLKPLTVAVMVTGAAKAAD